MDDDALARLLLSAKDTELKLRAHQTASERAGQIPERDMALVTGRQMSAVVRYLEQWISARACRAALQR